MSRSPTPISLSAVERETLRTWQRARSSERRLVERAEIVLRAADGQATGVIAAAMGTRPARVSKWRTRFARQRLRGLIDMPRPGAPRHYDAATERRVLACVDRPPPRRQATWTGASLAATLRDVSSHQVWRILRRHGISLRRGQTSGIVTAVGNIRTSNVNADRGSTTR